MCLWADDIHIQNLQGLPPPSVLVETSPGKFQAYWLLDAPSTDLALVERLNRDLAKALGGDNVGDRVRVMRLPGFLNVKPEHPDRPRSRLVECHADRRYSLEELGATLAPSLDETDDNASHESRQAGRNSNNGQFDPHRRGGIVPPSALEELKAELQRPGARWNSDGRLCMSCPLPHNGSDNCACTQAFYWSPISGQWWCFCSGHPGRSDSKIRVTGGAWSLWTVLFPG